MGKIWLLPISFVFIFLSPIVLWKSASQNRAGEFESAKEVNSESDEKGYILVEGEAVASENLACPNSTETSCIYVSEKVEEYTRVEKEVCSSTKPDTKILKSTAAKCDENDNCTPCYLTEEYSWEAKDSKVDQIEFKIGNYTIESINKANKIGLKEFEKIVPVETRKSEDADQDLLDYYYGEGESDPYYDVFEEDDAEVQESSTTTKEGDLKFTYSFFENKDDYVVAGEARNNEIYKGDDSFIVSSKSYGETLSTLGSQDSSASTTLKIVSFLLITFGFGMLFTTIAAIPLLLTKVIPFIGNDIKKLANSLLTFAGFMVGTMLWVVMFIMVSILKSPILLVTIFIGVAALGYWIWSKKKEVVKTEVNQ